MNEYRRLVFSVTCVITVAAMFPSSADIILFLLDDKGQQQAWEKALQGKVIKSSFDFDDLADFEIVGGDGPVGVEGNQFIPPGFMPENIVLDMNLEPFGIGGPNGRGAGSGGFDGVGPGAGFGNPSNAVIAGFFVDSFDIINTDNSKTAVEFTTASFLGSDLVTITVYDVNENQIAQFADVPASTAGHRIGLLATGGDKLGRVNLYDLGGGAEGIQGESIYYIPAPGVVVVIGMGLIHRSRRRANA